MPLPSTEDILTISRDHVSAFITEQANARTFSLLMKRLNDELVSADETVRAAARQALELLGFPEYA